MLFNRYTRIFALLGILSFLLAVALLLVLSWFSLTTVAVVAIFLRVRSFAKLSAYLRHSCASSAPRPYAAQSVPPPASGVRSSPYVAESLSGNAGGSTRGYCAADSSTCD